MKLIKSGKVISGLIYNSIKHGESIEPKIIHLFSKDLALKLYPSAGAEQTSGYAVSITVTNEQFQLYKPGDLNAPLNYLPTHKFVLKYVTDEIRTDWSLVYDGDGLFHIEGNLNSVVLGYSTDKLTQTQIALCLLDENDEIFMVSKNIFTQSIASSTTTVDFVSSTLTSELVSVKEEIEEEITLPHTITTMTVESKTFHLASSKDGATRYKLDYNKSVVV